MAKNTMNTHFILDQRLKNDTKFITSLKISDMLLMNDSRWPWLILVPRIANAIELHQLNAMEQTTIFSEMMQTSQILQDIFPNAKINIAALGNIVRQLHIHIIARHEGDANWPSPVWGFGRKIPYDDTAQKDFIVKIKNLLKQ